MDLLGQRIHVAAGVVQVGDDFVGSLLAPLGATGRASCYSGTLDFVDGEQTVQTSIFITTPYDGVDVFFVATTSSHDLPGFQRHASHLRGSDFVDVVIVSNAYRLDGDTVFLTGDIGLRQVDGTGVDYLGLAHTVERTVGQDTGTGATKGVGLEAGTGFQIRVEHVVGLGFDGFELTLEEHTIIIGQAGILVDQARDISTQGYVDYLAFCGVIELDSTRH